MTIPTTLYNKGLGLPDFLLSKLSISIDINCSLLNCGQSFDFFRAQNGITADMSVAKKHLSVQYEGNSCYAHITFDARRGGAGRSRSRARLGPAQQAARACRQPIPGPRATPFDRTRFTNMAIWLDTKGSSIKTAFSFVVITTLEQRDRALSLQILHDLEAARHQRWLWPQYLPHHHLVSNYAYKCLCTKFDQC